MHTCEDSELKIMIVQCYNFGVDYDAYHQFSILISSLEILHFHQELIL